MNVEGLIELFGEIPDGGDLYAKVIRDGWFSLSQGKLNANLDLRRRRAALAQHPRGVGYRVLTQFDCHHDEAALWVLGYVCGNCACGH